MEKLDTKARELRAMENQWLILGHAKNIRNAINGEQWMTMKELALSLEGEANRIRELATLLHADAVVLDEEHRVIAGGSGGNGGRRLDPINDF